MNLVPRFPPLLHGLATGPTNPFTVACDQAKEGVDAGLLTWSVGFDRMRAALVLAPETALEVAMIGYGATAVALQNALGVLVPPETAVHLQWDGGIRLNGGSSGKFYFAASTSDPKAVPDWLVIGLELHLELPMDYDPAKTPDLTALYAEGCGDIDPIELLESWARHSILWINESETAAGRANVHREFAGLLWKKGEQVSIPFQGQTVTGTLMGLDENFGALIKTEHGQTHLISLTTLVKEV